MKKPTDPLTFDASTSNRTSKRGFKRSWGFSKRWRSYAGKIQNHHKNIWTRWWFQLFFIFTPIWGRFPFWLIFFRWVETTNQYMCCFEGDFVHGFEGPMGFKSPLKTTIWIHMGDYMRILFIVSNHQTLANRRIPSVRSCETLEPQKVEGFLLWDVKFKGFFHSHGSSLSGVTRCLSLPGMSMELSNYLVSWVVIYLGDLQPTYVGVIIYLLSSMDILVCSNFPFCSRSFAGSTVHHNHLVTWENQTLEIDRYCQILYCPLVM